MLDGRSHNDLVFETAQTTLAGILAGPNFTIMLVNAMQANARTTLGQIVVDEAWDMAEALVGKYETKLADDCVKETE